MLYSDSLEGYRQAVRNAEQSLIGVVKTYSVAWSRCWRKEVTERLNDLRRAEQNLEENIRVREIVRDEMTRERNLDDKIDSLKRKKK